MTDKPADPSLREGGEPLGIDLRAERLVLSPHDIESLRRGVRRALDRSFFARGVVAGAAGALLLVAAGALAFRPFEVQAPPANAPVVVAAKAPPAFTAPAPAPVCPPPVVVAAAPPTATTATAATAAPVRRRAPPDAPRATAQSQTGSRLQLWLAAYKDIEQALADGRADHAVAEARALRARYPDGALVVEAGLLELRALRQAGRADEANALEASWRQAPPAPRTDDTPTAASDTP